MTLDPKRFTALEAFDLLMQCAAARRAPPSDTGVSEKNRALDVVLATLGGELRRVLSPLEDDEQEAGDG